MRHASIMRRGISSDGTSMSRIEALALEQNAHIFENLGG